MSTAISTAAGNESTYQGRTTVVIRADGSVRIENVRRIVVEGTTRDPQTLRRIEAAQALASEDDLAPVRTKKKGDPDESKITLILGEKESEFWDTDAASNPKLEKLVTHLRAILQHYTDGELVL